MTVGVHDLSAELQALARTWLRDPRIEDRKDTVKFVALLFAHAAIAHTPISPTESGSIDLRYHETMSWMIGYVVDADLAVEHFGTHDGVEAARAIATVAAGAPTRHHQPIHMYGILKVDVTGRQRVMPEIGRGDPGIAQSFIVDRETAIPIESQPWACVFIGSRNVIFNLIRIHKQNDVTRTR